MGGVPFSRTKENAREQLLSSDLNRGFNLQSRDIQDEFAYLSADINGTPYSSASLLTQVFGDTTGYTATIPAGRGYAWDQTFPGLTADDSANVVMRWSPTTLSFSNPDSTNPRIDLVVAFPNAVDGDLQSRNILLDPASRTASPQNVFKTTTPQSALSVITGTPSSTPAPPAVPLHQVALYEVYVPPSVPNASQFYFVPRLWRKAGFPASALSGVVTGGILTWDVSVDPGAASAPAPVFGSGKHRVLIEGELLTWTGSPTAATVTQDGGANPFSSAASANASKPYYIYACGGRYLPQLSLGQIGLVQTVVPICLVESLTPPDDDGHPTASISTPRGSTRLGAVYVGLGYVFRGTTNRQPLIMNRTTTWGKLPLEVAAGAANPVNLASMPSGAAREFVHAAVGQSGVSSNVLSAVGVNPSSMGNPTAVGDAVATVLFTSGAAGTYITQVPVVVPLDTSSTGLRYLAAGGASTIDVLVKGYGHKVRRISG